MTHSFVRQSIWWVCTHCSCSVLADPSTSPPNEEECRGEPLPEGQWPGCYPPEPEAPIFLDRAYLPPKDDEAARYGR